MDQDWMESRRVITEWYHEVLGIPLGSREQWVHCDDLVLHAPYECLYCDQYGRDLQNLRIQANMNFTGHYDADKWPDPATMSRPQDIIERWGGNVKKDDEYDV